MSAAGSSADGAVSERNRTAIARWALAVLGHRRAPLGMLAMISALSLGARLWFLGTPGEDSHGCCFVFDEKYYVNAARVIAGLPFNAVDTYHGASPAGTDPNGEHPQLGKLVIAAGMRLFGDNGWGWRSTAVLFGSAAILLLYWLVRSAGGSSWLAAGTAALAAGENLFMVSSRIAVLDIYCVPFMLGGAALYLRRRPMLAGLVLGVGACIKEFCLYGLLALVLLEGGRGLIALTERRHARANRQGAVGPASADRGLRAVLRLVAVVAVTLISYVSVLEVLDRAVVPYHNGAPVISARAAICEHTWLWSHACNHIAFMSDYATHLTGTSGIASHPWEFWADIEPVTYYSSSEVTHSFGTVTAVDHPVNFTGLINPVLLVLALPALMLNLFWAVRRRDDLSLLVVSWYVATWLPAELANLIGQRTTYLYYMVVTLPAMFIAVARLAGHPRVPRVVLGIWIGLLVGGFAVLYPFRTITGG